MLKHAIALVCLVAMNVLAADAPAPVIQWSARDLSNREVKVPAADRPTIIAFLRANQPQSADAVAQIRKVLEKQPPVQLVVTLSGQHTGNEVNAFVQAQKLDSVVIDPDYAVSGKMNIHVWPTTLVIATDGTQVAHLAGVPQSFGNELQAYVEFAGKKIDKATLDQQLAAKQTIVDTPQQAAARHQRIATTLIERGQLDQAKSEIEAGLKLQPNDPSLHVAEAKILLKLNQPAPALAAVEQLKDSIPPWQCNLLRAQALIALDRWDEAKLAVSEAAKLNPNPAGAFYLSGQVYAHEKNWEQAATEYRKAYEATQSEVPVR